MEIRLIGAVGQPRAQGNPQHRYYRRAYLASHQKGKGDQTLSNKDEGIRFMDLEELCRQVREGLIQGRDAGVIVPRYAAIEVQIQDGYVVHLKISAKIKPRSILT